MGLSGRRVLCVVLAGIFFLCVSLFLNAEEDHSLGSAASKGSLNITALLKLP